MVVAIISLLSGIAWPRYGRFSATQRLEAATRRVKLDLEAAKRRAVLTSSTQTVRFYVLSDFYRHLEAESIDHPGQTYTVELFKEPYTAAIASATFGSDAIVKFDGFGVPDTGGTVVITVGNLQQTVALDGTTGIASLMNIIPLP